MHLTAAQILATTAPGELFGAMIGANTRHRKLMKEWHPDIRPGDEAKAVSAHINSLWNEAEHQINLGTWSCPNHLYLTDMATDKTFELAYRRKHAFELGDCYVSNTAITYLVRNEFADLAHSAEQRINGLKFANDEAGRKGKLQFPKVKKRFESKCGHQVFVMEKPRDMYLAKDLLNAYALKSIPFEHVAWMVSRMLYISCALEVNKVSHCDISTETLLVSPRDHICMLTGGWWYAVPQDARMSALPARTHRYAPRHILEAKRGDTRLNLILLRQTAMELLGDPSGRSLGSCKPPMIAWLRKAPMDSAFHDYDHWQNVVLPASHGARRFVELKIEESVVYKEAP